MKSYNYRANCFLNKKDYKRAIAYFKKVIELNPEYADAYDSRCQIRFLQGKYHEALPDFDKAIMLDAQFNHALYRRNRAELAIKDTVSAMGDLNKAIKLNDSDAQYLTLREWLYLAQGSLRRP